MSRVSTLRTLQPAGHSAAIAGNVDGHSVSVLVYRSLSVLVTSPEPEAQDAGWIRRREAVACFLQGEGDRAWQPLASPREEAEARTVGHSAKRPEAACTRIRCRARQRWKFPDTRLCPPRAAAQRSRPGPCAPQAVMLPRAQGHGWRWRGRRGPRPPGCSSAFPGLTQRDTWP